jgi:hypothetical protein
MGIQNLGAFMRAVENKVARDKERLEKSSNNPMQQDTKNDKDVPISNDVSMDEEVEGNNFENSQVNSLEREEKKEEAKPNKISALEAFKNAVVNKAVHGINGSRINNNRKESIPKEESSSPSPSINTKGEETPASSAEDSKKLSGNLRKFAQKPRTPYVSKFNKPQGNEASIEGEELAIVDDVVEKEDEDQKSPSVVPPTPPAGHRRKHADKVITRFVPKHKKPSSQGEEGTINRFIPPLISSQLKRRLWEKLRTMLSLTNRWKKLIENMKWNWLLKLRRKRSPILAPLKTKWM